MPGYSEFYFNVDHGYLEGLVRGFKAGILTSADYVNLAQCETLEGKSAGFFHLGRNAVPWIVEEWKIKESTGSLILKYRHKSDFLLRTVLMFKLADFH